MSSHPGVPGHRHSHGILQLCRDCTLQLLKKKKKKRSGVLLPKSWDEQTCPCFIPSFKCFRLNENCSHRQAKPHTPAQAFQIGLGLHTGQIQDSLTQSPKLPPNLNPVQFGKRQPMLQSLQSESDFVQSSTCEQGGISTP